MDKVLVSKMRLTVWWRMGSGWRPNTIFTLGSGSFTRGNLDRHQVLSLCCVLVFLQDLKTLEILTYHNINKIQ